MRKFTSDSPADSVSITSGMPPALSGTGFNPANVAASHDPNQKSRLGEAPLRASL